MVEEFDKQIGARIKHFRQMSGLTQAKLAELSGCEPITIGRCETGKDRISLTLLKRIAQALNVKLYKFFIPRIPVNDAKTTQAILDLLDTADKTQLGLIYDTISNILDLT